MSFWCLQFFQKTNENNSTWGIIVVMSNFFVSFLEELSIPKSHFEINWALGLRAIVTFSQKSSFIESRMLLLKFFIHTYSKTNYRLQIWITDVSEIFFLQSMYTFNILSGAPDYPRFWTLGNLQKKPMDLFVVTLELLKKSFKVHRY